MATGAADLSLSKVDVKNFITGKYKVETFLKMKGLERVIQLSDEDYLDGLEDAKRAKAADEYVQKDQQAIGTIVMSLMRKEPY